MVTGKIRTLRVDKGFGFIKDDSGKEYFFHQSAVYGEGIDNLREGDSVEFDVGEGPKGPREKSSRHPVDKPADRDIIRDPNDGNARPTTRKRLWPTRLPNSGIYDCFCESGCRRFSKKRDGLVPASFFGSSLTSE